MKKSAIIAFLFVSLSVFAQTDADKILGTYFTEDNTGKVTISKKDGKYIGTLVWTNVPDALDTNNPDKNKRNEKIAGKVIMQNFAYNGKNTWDGGTIYDPESGKTYSGKITFSADGTLNLRGFVGISAFGRTSKWKRATD